MRYGGIGVGVIDGDITMNGALFLTVRQGVEGSYENAL